MSKCPGCLSEKINVTDMTTDGMFMHLIYKCNLCGMEWPLDAKMTGIKMEEINESSNDNMS